MVEIFNIKNRVASPLGEQIAFDIDATLSTGQQSFLRRVGCELTRRIPNLFLHGAVGKQANKLTMQPIDGKRTVVLTLGPTCGGCSTDSARAGTISIMADFINQQPEIERGMKYLIRDAQGNSLAAGPGS